MKRVTIDIEKSVFYHALNRLGLLLDAEQIRGMLDAFSASHCQVNDVRAMVAGYEEHPEFVRILLLSEDVAPITTPHIMLSNGTAPPFYPRTVRATAGGVIEYENEDGQYVPFLGRISRGIDWVELTGLNEKKD